MAWTRGSCGAYAGLALWLLGFADQAARVSEEATERARELGHPLSVAFALNLAALLFIARREPQAAEQRVDALIALSKEHGLPFWTAQSAVQQGWALIRRGRYEEGLAPVQTVLNAWRAEGRALLGPSYLAAIAEAHGALGQVGRGLEVVDEALTEVERTGERWWESELRRLKGDLILKAPSRAAGSRRQSVEDAEKCFQQALVVARAQGARSLELRAAVSLARLARGRDKETAAYVLLRETYDWFTEGLETPDLQEARTLLAAGRADSPEAISPARTSGRGVPRQAAPRARAPGFRSDDV
jgi:predicted ATPase